ncbi:hypothetical protein [Nocardia lijiangensis]|uniref:hypothetical protein n=1 Tax=Nocardia lijiangensis TaxID=299618 RepID=UPI000ABFCF4F|nr:hypothetical protein [Nocardia lijiangensis]
MSENTTPEAPQVNPLTTKAAAGVRKRRTRKPAPMPSFAPTPGQLSLFDLSEGDPS